MDIPSQLNESQNIGVFKFIVPVPKPEYKVYSYRTLTTDEWVLCIHAVPRVHNRRQSVLLPYSASKMSWLSREAIL